MCCGEPWHLLNPDEGREVEEVRDGEEWELDMDERIDEYGVSLLKGKGTVYEVRSVEVPLFGASNGS